MSDYVCAGCGSERVVVDPSRPSLDDRFAIGRCLPEDERAKASKHAPKMANLVRTDYAATVARQRAEKAAMARRASAAKAASTPGSKVSVKRIEEGKRLVEELYR